MTEQRSTTYGGQGLFATQNYKEGSIIFTESSPIVRLAPATDEQEARLFQLLPPSTSRGDDSEAQQEATKIFLETIQVPSSIPSDYANTFRTMVQAALCFLEWHSGDSQLETELLELCRPTAAACTNEADPIVTVAKEVIQYLQTHCNSFLMTKNSNNSSNSNNDADHVLLQLLLVYSCNSFAGGRIYKQSSRLNHSCDPSCIVVTTKNTGLELQQQQQSIVAACNVQMGDELTISYLGIVIYADTLTRTKKLQLDKHFCCQCSRCASGIPDVAAAIPCPCCHVRQGRYLNDNVAYDDNHDEWTVYYTMPTTTDPNQYKCQHCDTICTTTSTKDLSIVSLVSTKVSKYLDTYHTIVVDHNHDDDNDETTIQEQLLELSTLTLGSKHWTTNILSLLHMDAMLQKQHATMIASSGNEIPSMEELAHVIDTLEKLERFITRLQLKMHMGHVLSNAIVGVARSLVSLGDTKSKTFANTWIQKIKNYTLMFESEGMQKVVAKLENAYKDGDDQYKDYGGDNKKQRKK